jgi:hypothetical protein
MGKGRAGMVGTYESGNLALNVQLYAHPTRSAEFKWPLFFLHRFHFAIPEGESNSEPCEPIRTQTITIYLSYRYLPFSSFVEKVREQWLQGYGYGFL